jgi:S-phase kinase-associated protein 1
MESPVATESTTAPVAKDAVADLEVQLSELALKGDKKITLITDDGKSVTVSALIALESKTIAEVYADLKGDKEDSIPEYPVSDPEDKDTRQDILIRVLNMTAYNKSRPEDAQVIKDRVVEAKDREICSTDHVTVMYMCKLANYLNIPAVLDITAKMIGEMMIGKTPDEIREMFGEPDDLTPEEKEQIRKENEWCEER